MALHFTADYIERATLRDGTAIVIRLLTPEDKQLLAAGFAKLSEHSRYTRFLSPKLELQAHELRYLTEVDHEDHFALGAIREEGDGHGAPVGLGIARFIRLADGTSAEAAITVADEAQRKGLGRMLMLRLCAAAAERGIEHFRCEVLGSNAAAIKLLSDISPHRTIEVSEGVMTIDLPLLPVPPEHPAEGPPPDGPLYAMLRAAAANAIEWTEAVKRLWRRG